MVPRHLYMSWGTEVCIERARDGATAAAHRDARNESFVETPRTCLVGPKT